MTLVITEQEMREIENTNLDSLVDDMMMVVDSIEEMFDDQIIDEMLDDIVFG